MTLLEKAQELVGKAKDAAGRLTGDRATQDRRQPDPTLDDPRDRIADAAQDARDRYNGGH